LVNAESGINVKIGPANSGRDGEMPMTYQGEYNREQMALYLTGMLPPDQVEALAVLDLCRRFLPILAESRATHPEDQRRLGDDG
jgi:hypothetical protein